MTARPTALTAAQARRAAELQSLLQAGRPIDALAPARALAMEAPLSPDAHHLLALVLAANGQVADAEAGFRAALALVPGQVQISVNLARFLRRSGRARDAIQVLASLGSGAPDAELGWARLEAGDAAGARDAFARRLRSAPNDATAWQGSGSAWRALHDLDAAAGALERSLQLAPDSMVAQVNLGAVERLRGHPGAALAHFDRARDLGNASPALRDARIGALVDLGQPERALEEARLLVASHPEFAPGQATLVHLLWEHGARLAPGEEPMQRLRADAQARAGDRALQLTLARLLIESSRPHEALEVLGRLGSGSEDPERRMLEADALDRSGELAQASSVYADLDAVGALQHPEWINAQVRNLIRAQRPELAAQRAEAVLQRDRDNQTAWAYLATAWRLLDDPRERWLCGYDELCTLAPVPPLAQDEAALRALEAALLPLHRASNEPMQQSLRGGSQTPGRLFGRDDAALVAARAALLQAVERHLASLPSDATHPFLRRRERSVHLLGSWSVRLWSSGRHVDHIHHEGWMSSAFYVSLPSSVRAAESGLGEAGCLQLGRPPVELGLALEPRRVLRPKPGWLALFPSYVWHGTAPFEDSEPRLTIAFDMQPRA